MVENLLDLAHAPFTHIGTFARGWPVPSFVKFKTPLAAMAGTWDPYPIAMESKPPCMVLSTIGFAGIGIKGTKIGTTAVDACAYHLHQRHVCTPSTGGKTRLLYRKSLD
jgi:chlorophyllide a oxygenase